MTVDEFLAYLFHWPTSRALALQFASVQRQRGTRLETSGSSR